MNILVVDDEELIRNVIKEYLIIEKYNVYEASNGEEAIKIVKNNNVDLVIMDIMMPKMDGYTAVKKIKELQDIQFIILSAKSQEYDKLTGFDLGIDDYITKPFSPKELVARVKAILKRKNNNIYSVAGIVMDDIAHEVYVDKVKINLSIKLYDLLKLFLTNQNIALSRETIISKIWGYDFFGDERTVDTHVKMLRQSLGNYKYLIVTIRGLGYKIENKK